MKNLLLIALITIVSLIGCSSIYDLWPTYVPASTKLYANKDQRPNKWPCISTLKRLREECITKNIITQTNLANQMYLDKALYGQAIEQANLNIQQAELERAQVIGTIQSPGWLLSFLLPAVGGLAGSTITKLTHYSEDELQQKLKEATASATDTNKAQPA
jgi:hypothetical protein